MRLKNALKLKFILVFFDSVYPTRPSNNVTKYTVYLPIVLVERLFELSWVLFCYFILWLAKPGSKMTYRIFARVCFHKFPFFIPSFLHQGSNCYYLVVATVKIQKFENVRLWTSIFRYENTKVVPLIASELFNRNLPIVHPTLFLIS